VAEFLQVTSYSYRALDFSLRSEPFRHSSQGLNGSSHQKLVSRTFEAAQSQPIEPQDAFEVGKQHLHLLLSLRDCS
jgi:hypothetical protein